MFDEQNLFFSLTPLETPRRPPRPQKSRRARQTSSHRESESGYSVVVNALGFGLRACSACLMSKTFFFSLPPSHLAAAPPLRARRRETRPGLCPLYPRPGGRLQKKSWHDASRLRAGTRPSTLCRSPPPDTKAEPSTPKHKHAAWPAVFAPGAMAWRR